MDQDRQSLFLHLGLPKSGTTFLQRVLASHRDDLAEHEYVYPFVRPEAMFHAAVELRGQHTLWGLDPAVIDGTWDALVQRVRDTGRTGVVSHEILAGAAPAVVQRVRHSLDGLDLNVVVTARDLARQAVAHWQEEVKNGRPWSFADFESVLFEPEESSQHELGFWRSQDLTGVLDRWSGGLPADRVHIVVVPPPKAPQQELWHRFGEALGLGPWAADWCEIPTANESLGAAQVALLRRVLVALDGRITQPDYAHVVKRLFAQQHLAGVTSWRAVAPLPLVERLNEVSVAWLHQIAERGYTVHGNLEDLVSVHSPEEVRHPDDVTADELSADLAEVVSALVEQTATLRDEAAAG